ncbi:MAG: prepilin-type N-terminal cleavage/methylation domain-containing protein [bacterium]
MHSSKKGFTLAEVLVTLAIIGVVAALTIPTLIQSTNNDKYKVGLKKTIGTLNQALMSVSVDGTTIPTAGETGAALVTLLKDSLNILTINSDTIWLSDGTKITFVGANGCALITNSAPFTKAATQCYAVVDVNGDKGPNKGATGTTFNDVYVLGVSANGIVPVGGLDSAFALPANFMKDVNGATIAAPGIPYTDNPVPGNASINVVTGGTT